MKRLSCLSLTLFFAASLAGSAVAQDDVVVETRGVSGPVRVSLTSNAPTVPVLQPVSREATPDTSDVLPLRGSRKALSFTFDEFSLDGIDAGVGGKYWFSSNVALRSSFRFRVTSREDDIGTQENRGETTIGVGLGLVAERHAPDISPFSRVSPYLGVGFVFGVDAFSRSSQFPLENAIQETSNDGRTIFLGVQAGFGAEFRVSRRVSLAGEHLFGARINTGYENFEEIRRDEPNIFLETKNESFALSTGTSSLILSVYF